MGVDGDTGGVVAGSIGSCPLLGGDVVWSLLVRILTLFRQNDLDFR